MPEIAVTAARRALAATAVLLLGVASAARAQDLPARPPPADAALPYSSVTPVAPPGLSPKARAACLRAGGVPKRGGLAGAERCVHRLKDADKRCTDDAQCLGGCVVDDAPATRAPGVAVTGRCKVDDDPFGCVARVREGQVYSLCVD
jgi:hypothetical protein